MEKDYEYVSQCIYLSIYLSSMYNTFGLKKSEIRYWLDNFRESNVPMSNDSTAREYFNEEDEGLNIENEVVEYDRENRNNVTKKKQSTDSIKKFFEILPTLPSHYCRKNSNKLFLQTDIKPWTQLYNVYKKRCQENCEVPLSRNTFDREKNKRNIDIYLPKKDRCDTCTSFENNHVTTEMY